MATTSPSADLRGGASRTAVKFDGSEEDYQRILEAIQALPDKNSRSIKWNPRLDELLVKFYPIKRKKDLARFFGVSDRSLYERYQELTRGKHE
jgi:hypothetical protein